MRRNSKKYSNEYYSYNLASKNNPNLFPIGQYIKKSILTMHSKINILIIILYCLVSVIILKNLKRYLITYQAS